MSFSIFNFMENIIERKALFFVLITYFLSSCNFILDNGKCQNSKELHITKDHKTNLYGYKNNCNEIVIPYQFDDGNNFDQHVAVVEKNKQKFLIDTTGKIISQGFDFIRSFSSFNESSLYTIAKKGDKTHLLHINGKTYASVFNRIDLNKKSGYALLIESDSVEKVFNLNSQKTGEPFGFINRISNQNYIGREYLSDRKWKEFLLDSNGIKISAGFDGLHFDKEYEAYIKVTNNSKKTTPSSLDGLLSSKGELVLEPIYAHIKVFPTVISANKYNKKLQKKYSLFNLNGTLIKDQLLDIGYGDEGVLRLATSSTNTFAYYTFEGNSLTKTTKDFPIKRYKAASKRTIFHGTALSAFGSISGGSYPYYGHDFKDGLACFINKNDKWGYINKTGEIVIPCIYNKAYNFNAGKGKVYKGNRVFIINKRGDILEEIKPTKK